MIDRCVWNKNAEKRRRAVSTQLAHEYLQLESAMIKFVCMLLCILCTFKPI